MALEETEAACSDSLHAVEELESSLLPQLQALTATLVKMKARRVPGGAGSMAATLPAGPPAGWAKVRRMSAPSSVDNRLLQAHRTGFHHPVLGTDSALVDLAKQLKRKQDMLGFAQKFSRK